MNPANTETVLPISNQKLGQLVRWALGQPGMKRPTITKGERKACIDSLESGEAQPTATETWHDPAIQALKDAWAELCDHGHDAAADAVFQMIQRRTGLEGLEYEVKKNHDPVVAQKVGIDNNGERVSQDVRASEFYSASGLLSKARDNPVDELHIPQTAPGKEYQPEACAETLTEEHDKWKRRMLKEGVTHDATGGNADTDLFQPGWSKVVFVGGPIHGHEGLLPAGVSLMLVVRGDHSYSYSSDPGGIMTYVGAEVVNG